MDGQCPGGLRVDDGQVVRDGRGGATGSSRTQSGRDGDRQEPVVTCATGSVSGSGCYRDDWKLERLGWRRRKVLLVGSVFVGTHRDDTYSGLV